MDHPFKVGEKYRNRKGEYEVVQLDQDDMTVRYSDGSLMKSAIELQARIWENIQFEEKRKTSEKQTKKQVVKNPKRKPTFQGLEENDFQKGVAGTCWRARTGLGGYLSQQMCDTTSYDFQSYSIYRRAEVHIASPDWYDETHSFKKAKFVFNLNPDYARCGFYVEKNNGEMDDTWDWNRFIGGLESLSDQQKTIEKTMEQDHLHWELFLWSQGELPIEVEVTTEGLLWRDPKENINTPIDWAQFIRRLHAIPENEWCDLFLCRHIDKTEAIAAGLCLVESVTEIYRTLLPYYEVSIKESDK